MKTKYTEGLKAGTADDLLSEHRDADGGWVTVAQGVGKWDVRVTTTASAHCPPLSGSARCRHNPKRVSEPTAKSVGISTTGPALP